MAHEYLVEDDNGDLVDTVTLCSDSCHQQYCRDNDLEYMGWNGCQEIQFTEPCAQCECPVMGVFNSQDDYEDYVNGDLRRLR
jgi:hypothetical protein